MLSSKGTGEPGDNASDTICTLDKPTDLGTSGVKTFTAPAACGTLATETNYFVYILYNNLTLAGSPRLRKTTSLGQDSTGVAEWTVSDEYYYDPTSNVPVGWIETSNADVIEIRIRAANMPPTASGNTVSTEDTKTLTFTAARFRLFGHRRRQPGARQDHLAACGYQRCDAGHAVARRRGHRNLSTTLRHRRFLFTDSLLLLWKWRVG